MSYNHEGRDAERELQNIQRRFRTITSRYERKIWFKRFAKRSIIIAFAGFIALFVVIKLSPWSASETLRHIASFPNCASARFFGLAPAYRGKPGYYASHDADEDGVACEPWQTGKYKE